MTDTEALGLWRQWVRAAVRLDTRHSELCAALREAGLDPEPDQYRRSERTPPGRSPCGLYVTVNGNGDFVMRMVGDERESASSVAALLSAVQPAVSAWFEWAERRNVRLEAALRAINGVG